MKKLTSIILALALAVLLTACGGTPTGDPAAAPGATTTTTQTPVNNPAPDNPEERPNGEYGGNYGAFNYADRFRVTHCGGDNIFFTVRDSESSENDKFYKMGRDGSAPVDITDNPEETPISPTVYDGYRYGDVYYDLVSKKSIEWEEYLGEHKEEYLKNLHKNMEELIKAERIELSKPISEYVPDDDGDFFELDTEFQYEYLKTHKGLTEAFEDVTGFIPGKGHLFTSEFHQAHEADIREAGSKLAETKHKAEEKIRIDYDKLHASYVAIIAGEAEIKTVKKVEDNVSRWVLFVDGEWIYYQEGKRDAATGVLKEPSLHRISVDGTKENDILKDTKDYKCFNFTGDYIFYIKPGEEIQSQGLMTGISSKNITRVKADGTGEEETIVKGLFHQLNSSGEYLYTSSLYGKAIGKIKITDTAPGMSEEDYSSKAESLIIENNTSGVRSIAIYYDWIFYKTGPTHGSQDDKWCMVKTDFTGKKDVFDNRTGALLIK